MTIKTYIPAIIIIIIGLTSIFSKCNKNIFGCAESSLFFTIDAKVYPDKDSVCVGDTLWVEMNFPTTLTEQKTNTTVDYSGATNFGTVIGFLKMVNKAPITLEDAAKDFDLILVSGTEIRSLQPKYLRAYMLSEFQNRYIFKLGIIPKESGIFSINIHRANNVMRKDKSCPKAAFYFVLKNTTDQHYYFDPDGANVEPAGADYYFYVK